MKIFYDTNNFVRQVVSKETCVCTSCNNQCALDHEDLEIIEIDPELYPGLTCVNWDEYDDSSAVLDRYGIPLFKWSTDHTVLITDPADYQVDAELWARYMRKLKDEVDNAINTMTDLELKTLYDTSPDYKKTMIYQEIENLAASKVDQTVMNLVLEVGIRCLAEWAYIKEVENRTPTDEETLGFKQLLTTIHNHSIGMGMPISTTSWYQGYVSYVLQNSDILRTATFTKRYYVTGMT